MLFKELMKVIPSVGIIDVWKQSGTNIVFAETFRYFVGVQSYKNNEVAELRIVSEDRLKVIIKDEGKEYIVMYYDDKKKKDISKVMGINRICRDFRVTEKQVQKAVRTGQSLKTMYFDEM